MGIGGAHHPHFPDEETEVWRGECMHRVQERSERNGTKCACVGAPCARDLTSCLRRESAAVAHWTGGETEPKELERFLEF